MISFNKTLTHNIHIYKPFPRYETGLKIQCNSKIQQNNPILDLISKYHAETIKLYAYHESYRLILTICKSTFGLQLSFGKMPLFALSLCGNSRIIDNLCFGLMNKYKNIEYSMYYNPLSYDYGVFATTKFNFEEKFRIQPIIGFLNHNSGHKQLRLVSSFNYNQYSLKLGFISPEFLVSAETEFEKCKTQIFVATSYNKHLKSSLGFSVNINQL